MYFMPLLKILAFKYAITDIKLHPQDINRKKALINNKIPLTNRF